MSRRAAAAIGLCLFLVSTISVAESTVLKLCTGPQKGNYYASGEEIARQVARWNVEVQLAETEGSMDNLSRMADLECDAGFAQIDAYLDYQAMHQEDRLEVEWPRHLYEEFVHLVCRRDVGVESIEDLRQPNADRTLMAGAPGSGTAITWRSMTRLRPDYLAVTTQEAANDQALQAVANGKASCLMLVSGLKSDFLARVDEAGDQLRLVPVGDKAFGEAKHFDRPIYQFKAIPKGSYRNLQAPSGAPVETLTVRAVMLISRAWAGNHPRAYDTVIEGLQRATPIIRERVAGR